VHRQRTFPVPSQCTARELTKARRRITKQQHANVMVARNSATAQTKGGKVLVQKINPQNQLCNDFVY